MTKCGFILVISGGVRGTTGEKSIEQYYMKKNKWKSLPNMERERAFHASTVLNQAQLYLFDEHDITVLNIVSHSHVLKITSLQISRNQFVFAEKWKNGIIIFRQFEEEIAILSEEGKPEEVRNYEKEAYCNHGFGTLYLGGHLLAVDDQFQIFKIPLLP